jgi:hypothetical protein
MCQRFQKKAERTELVFLADRPNDHEYTSDSNMMWLAATAVVAASHMEKSTFYITKKQS